MRAGSGRCRPTRSSHTGRERSDGLWIQQFQLAETGGDGDQWQRCRDRQLTAAGLGAQCPHEVITDRISEVHRFDTAEPFTEGVAMGFENRANLRIGLQRRRYDIGDQLGGTA